jgi:Ni,Fe-hydrogenase III large subunit
VPTVQTRTGGDVLSRFLVRTDEITSSVALITDLAHSDRIGVADDARTEAGGGFPRSGVGIAEGWRGTITHRVEVDGDGILTRVKIVDPSFFNWPALPVALADTIVPDFPLANKSFNLSYAGNDL